MNFSRFVALRYLFSRKSNNVINFITWISMVAIAVVTAALIIVLSVFNGLTTFIEDLYSALDPDIRVTAVVGQTFTISEETLQKLREHPEVAVVSRSLEGKVAMKYFDRQTIAIVKGIEPSFTEKNAIAGPEYTYEGSFTFEPRQGYPQGVMGSQVAAILGANIFDEENPITLYVPTDRKTIIPVSSVPSIREAFFFPSGYFSVQKEYDERYVLVDLEFARDLFESPEEISALEIDLKDPDKVEKVKKELQAILGDELQALSWFEQHDTLYRVMRNEKYVSYLILTLMLVIAAVNIIGSLSMVVLEKTRDIAAMRAMGAGANQIRRIFLNEGILVGGIGVGAGMFLGLVFCLLQKYVGLIRLQGGESFRVEYFPVELQGGDFLLIFCTVLGLSILAALYPSIRAAQLEIVEGLRK